MLSKMPYDIDFKNGDWVLIWSLPEMLKVLLFATDSIYSALPNNRAVTTIYLGIFSNIFIK